MKYELIITEKPNAALKIADALADGKAIKENIKGVPYYLLTHGKRDIVVACAVGHLYGLAEKNKKGWRFPVFDIEWVPSYEMSKGSAFTKNYLEAIRKLSKDADEFTIATDYDVEGEVIGLNVVRYICKQKDANRMKFSTLTKPDIVEAYENKSRHLDWGQAKSGETRHFLDWINGINYSRALTSSIKRAGAFKIMSTGRVQGPSLKIIVDREKDIKDFKPEPFWQIELSCEAKKQGISAWHEADKFWKKEEAEAILSRLKGEKKAKVEGADKKEFTQMPPTPFDLTTLQTESYRCHGIQPKDTLAIAQELYTSTYISYPRTSSQILDPKIGFHKILGSLAKQPEYAKLAGEILKKQNLRPNNGAKTDPAHPAIYPTGISPGELNDREGKVYDLIAKRFMATFAEPAIRQTMTVNIMCRNERFIAKGTTTISKGWHNFYEPYVKLEEEQLPAVEKDDEVAVKRIKMHDKETQPPKRYTPASIIKELEKRNLGTKSTRSEIIDTLFRRGYVTGKSIEATELGIRTAETLEKYAPKIIDEELTRGFEDDMENIREGKTKPEDVLVKAENAITKIIDDFKVHEKEIGEGLLTAERETKDTLSYIGQCPNCKDGQLHLRKGKYGTFTACNRYPDCKTTFSLPSNAVIKPSGKSCETCGFPMVASIKKAKKPMDFCLNPNCKSKYAQGEAGKQAKKIAEGTIEKQCPKCMKGKLVLRSSIYGKFYGCSNYPKCKHTERLDPGVAANSGKV